MACGAPRGASVPSLLPLLRLRPETPCWTKLQGTPRPRVVERAAPLQWGGLCLKECGGGYKGVLQSGELELGLPSSQTQGPSLLPGDMLTPGIRVLAAMTGQH